MQCSGHPRPTLQQSVQHQLSNCLSCLNMAFALCTCAVKFALICSSRLTTEVVLESEVTGLPVVCFGLCFFSFLPLIPECISFLVKFFLLLCQGSGGRRDATAIVKRSSISSSFKVIFFFFFLLFLVFLQVNFAHNKFMPLSGNG